MCSALQTVHSISAGGLCRRHPRRLSLGAGFTLLEMLVGMVVIGVLTTLVWGGVGKVREKAAQTLEVAAARYLITTFHSISTEKGRVFSSTEYAGGESPSAQAENIRYLTHMVGYVDESELESILFFHPEQQELLATVKRKDGHFYSYIRSLYPTFGMNAPVVGGEYYDGVAAVNRAYVTQMDEVVNPGKLIVFISTASSASGYGLDTDLINGYFKATSPYNGRLPTMFMWGKAKASSPSNTGNVHFRWDGQAVAAFFDGSVRLVDDKDISSPEYWLNDTSAFNF